MRTLASISSPPHRAKFRGSVAVFWHFACQYPGRTLATVAGLVLSGAAEGLSITVFMPLLQQITDGALDSGGRLGEWIFGLFAASGIEPSLPVLLGCIVVGLTLKGLLYWMAMNQVGYTVARVATDLRVELLRVMIQARWEYFTNQPAGEFANAIASEALKASGAYQSAAYVLACTIQLGVYTLLAFLLSWQTALAGIITGLLFVGLMQRLVMTTRKAGKQQVVLLKSVTGRIVDMLHGLKPIRAMAREMALVQYLEAEAEALNTAQRTEVRAAASVAASQEPIMAVVMALGLFIIFTWKLLPFSALLILAFLFSRLFNQVNQIVQHYQRFVSYESAFFSIRDRIHEAFTHRESDSGLPAPYPLRKGIILSKLSFSYGNGSVLRDVTLQLPARKWTSLVGPSGAGKTTLLDLIVGLHVPQTGKILLDGQPLTEISLVDWRRHIGYVPQEMLLFNGSVFDNVTLGDPEITPANVEQALRATDAWDFVVSLPRGMDTPVGERGARLSGGQRQRIALARALVCNPELLILDEATASLDPATEASLCETLVRLSRGTTILAISHQPAVAKAADLVYEVRGGTITLVRGEVTEL